MRALIYGISGQDGAYLAKFLLDRGYEVWGASRDASVGRRDNLIKLDIANRVKVISTTLTDFRSVLTSLDRSEPDEIYNLSGQSSVSLSFEEPMETMQSISAGTLNLLECVRFLGKPSKVYNASSSECFGDVGEHPADETTAFRPRSPYGVAKATSHWQVVNYRESYGIYACNGILFNHESPLRPARFVTRKVVAAVAAIKQGSKEKLRLGNTDIIRDWGWAPEYVEAMWLMLQRDNPEDYVIATGESHSLKAFVDEAFRVIGKDPEEFVQQDNQMLRPSDILHSYANVSKAADQLGWSATTKMADVVRRMVSAEEERTASAPVKGKISKAHMMEITGLNRSQGRPIASVEGQEH
jgi:GDPmannose 4,6-dehydratase